MRKLRRWWGKTSGPSEEAKAARAEVQELTEKADIVYYERRYLLQRNHFAERIRLIYEGHPHADH